MEINGIEYEFILTGSGKNGECLVCLMGHDEERAKKRLEQMLTAPTPNDLRLMNGRSDFKLRTVESATAWWNDPVLRN